MDGTELFAREERRREWEAKELGCGTRYGRGGSGESQMEWIERAFAGLFEPQGYDCGGMNDAYVALYETEYRS